MTNLECVAAYLENNADFMYMWDKVQLFEAQGQTLHDIHEQVSSYAEFDLIKLGYTRAGRELINNTLITMGCANKIIYELFLYCCINEFIKLATSKQLLFANWGLRYESWVSLLHGRRSS